MASLRDPAYRGGNAPSGRGLDVDSGPAAVDLPGAAEFARAALAAGVADPSRLRWTVEAVDHARIIDTTGGLYDVRGHPGDGDAPEDLRLVVKVLTRSDGGECDAADSWCYWRREATFYASDLPASLPSALRAPQGYHVTTTSSTCWVWMERVTDELVETWRPDDYHRVAQAAGESAGIHLAQGRPPTRPWLVRGFLRSVLADGGLWAGLMSRESAGSAWTLPVVHETFDRADSAAYDELWGRRHDLLAVLDTLPAVLCHNDFHRRNVLLPSDRAASPVAVDWAFAGSGALATDAAHLVGGTLFFCDVDVSLADELEATVYDGYLHGLRRSGWGGDERLVRLGFCASLALWQGLTLPGWVGIMLSDEDAEADVVRLFGVPAEEVRAAWVRLWRGALQRADEAVSLSRELGLGFRGMA